MCVNHIGRGRPEAIVDGARAGTAGEGVVVSSAERGEKDALRMHGAARSREIVRTPADRTGSRGYTMTKRSPHSPIGRGSRLKIGAVSVRVRLGAQIAGPGTDCGEALDGRETTSETASELKAGE